MELRRKSASFCSKMANFYKFYNDFNDFLKEIIRKNRKYGIGIRQKAEGTKLTNVNQWQGRKEFLKIHPLRLPACNRRNYLSVLAF
jgi:hypothetical protein